MFGKRAVLYYLTPDTRATWGNINATTGRNESATAPTNLVEIGSAKDVTVPGDRPSSEQHDRGTNFATFDVGALRTGAAFQLNKRTTVEAGVTALRSASLIQNATIALAILDGADDVVGTTGLWADFVVEQFEESQPEEGHIVYNVVVKPFDSGVDPEFVEVIA